MEISHPYEGVSTNNVEVQPRVFRARPSRTQRAIGHTAYINNLGSIAVSEPELEITQDYQQTNLDFSDSDLNWLSSALHRIRQISELPENWDSYGSTKVTSKALEASKTVLYQLHEEVLPDPFICPVPGGGIQFEWEVGTRELELEFMPNGSIEFLTVDKAAANLEDGMMEGVVDGFSSVVVLSNWLLQGN